MTAISSPVYSRHSPSQRYQELLRLYKEMHDDGARLKGKAAEDTFPGKSMPRHAEAIRELIDMTAATSLLDYGCGKGQQYRWRDIKLSDGQVVDSLMSYWGHPEVAKYDPGYEPYSHLPEGKFDGVVCTDVLEHCPEEDLPWILDELFAHARRFVYANVACFPAKKRLPSGENAHVTVRPPAWWEGLIIGIAHRHPGVRYRILLATKPFYRRFAKRLGLPKTSKQIFEGIAR